MAEEKESVSVSQVRDFLNLFRQEGRSFTGAVLLEIAWVALLVLASKLTTTEAPGPIQQGHASLPSIWSVPLIEIWAVGAGVIFCFWMMHSGLLWQVFALIGSLLKPLGHLFLSALLIAFGVFDTLWTALVVKPLVLPRAKEQYKKEWIEREKGKNPGLSDEEAAAAYQKYMKEFEDKSGKRALETEILQQNRFGRFSIWSLW